MSSSITGITDIQKIMVTLSEPDITIEPGQVGQLTVTMTNGQEMPDRLALEIEGIDIEWYNIQVSAVNVAPGAHAAVRIPFRIARSSENRAGTYPFLIRVQGMESGEVAVSQAALIIKPFHSLQLELDPKRTVASYFARYNEIEVVVSNQGNTEETLDLAADDPDDGCAYEFASDRITLRPGQSEAIAMTVSPKALSLLGGVQLYGFKVTARSVADSYVAANAHGQLEKRALISPMLGIFLLLLSVVGLGVWWFRPRPVLPPVINVFDATQKRVNASESVTLTWDVSGPPNSQIILYEKVINPIEASVDVPLGDQRNTVGSLVVQPKSPRTVYTLLLRSSANRTEVRKEVAIDVNPPPPAPKPSIKTFYATPPVIHVGETVTLTWEARGHKEVILDPGNIRLSKFDQTYTATPDRDMNFKLRAVAEADNVEPASKSVFVRVVPKEVCIAEVRKFTVPNGTVYVGDKIKLRWETRFARKARIDIVKGDAGGTPVSVDVTPGDGSYEVAVEEPMTFTLVATDSAGQFTTRQITVTPKVRPVAPDPNSTDGTPQPPANMTAPPPGGAGVTP